jgi:hypothetical protein
MSYKVVRVEWGRVVFVFQGVYNTESEAKAAKRRIQGMSGGTCKNLRVVEEQNGVVYAAGNSVLTLGSQ